MNISKKVHTLIVLGAALSSSLLAQVTGDSPERSGRPVTVADTIEMTQTGAGNSFDAAALRGKAVEFSPDGSKFAFTTQKGDLKKDVISFSVWVYDTATAVASPKPRLVATLESSSNRPAISQLKWLRDNDTLVFLGEGPEETPQIYKVKASGGRLEKLTNQATPIVSFAMSDRANAFVYLAETKAPPIFSAKELRRGFFVAPDRRWDDLYFNERKFDIKDQLYVKTTGMRASQATGDALDVLDAGSLSISPNGEYAFFLAANPQPPASWDQYQGVYDGQVTPSRRDCLAGKPHGCPFTFWLVDLKKQTVRPLVNAPWQMKYDGLELAVWTEENTVVLVNALLPLDGVSGEERSRRERKFYSAEVTPSGEIHPIAERDKVLLVSTIAAESGRVVVKPFLSFGVPFEFRKRAGKWEMRQISSAEAEPRLPLAVRIEQGINEPPMLVAEQEKTKQRAVLMDLNPQFREMTFGRVEVFKWKSRDGLPNGGELYYPVGYAAGQRYPLVIQTHGESREVFWIQGPFSTTNAAQALANKGFFVLQMGVGDRYDESAYKLWLEAFSTSKEGPFFTAAVEGAIDELDRGGLIDRSRVGLGGFSRSVYNDEYLMTHSSYPIGAAVLADGADFGYVNCVYYLAPQFGSVCEKMNGGLPWGDTLSNWVKESPTLRLDKIHTPLLMQSISAPLGEWELYAGLQWLRKPVELINFYPEGEHELVRPQQKLLSEQSAVDWYCFWLKREEDPDPTKAELYKRWRELRRLQADNEKKIPTDSARVSH